MEAKAMLCDYAQVAQGKLFVSGAGINLLGVQSAQPPLTVNVALAVLVTIPWNSTNQPHALTIELVSDQGAGGSSRVTLTDRLPPNHEEADRGMIVAEFNAGRSPNMKPGEDTLMPVALPFFGLALPQPGSYFFVIRIDGAEVDRVSFRVEVVNAGMFGMPF